MRKQRPILIDLEYIHPCWCIATVEKLAEGKILLVSPLRFMKNAEEGLFELEAPDVGKLIKALGKSPHVKKIEVLQKTKTWALANVVCTHDSLILAKLMRTKSTPLLPTLTKGDRDFVTLIVPSEHDLRLLSSLLKEDTEYRVRSKKYLEPHLPRSLFNSQDFLKFKLVTEHLPEKQREAFLFASQKGYYALPKKTTVEELALKMGVSPSTMAEHLRKAEGRLLSLFGEVLENEPKPQKQPRQALF